MLTIEQTKTCSRCKLDKSLTEFPKHRRDSWCKLCSRTYQNQYHKDHPDMVKNNYLKTYYNITLEQYTTMLVAQNFRCALCPMTDPGRGNKSHYKYFCVDHDHNCCAGAKSCGKCVRGLLCYNCNNLLGSARDNKETLQNAINYLSKGAK